MKIDNQISLIKDFINSDDKTILINQVSDEIEIFYIRVIEYFANHQKIAIKNDVHNYSNLTIDDLFGKKTIQIHNTNNTKKLEALINNYNKKIIFTDYKNYKKFNSKLLCINGYQFENDIAFFIRYELDINNNDLIFYCKNNTPLLFSETSKYLINNNRFSVDRFLNNEKNHILDIRKSIFENKLNKSDIKNLYENIKKEAKYKRLNFLTY